MDLSKARQTIQGHVQLKPTTEPGDVILVGMPSGIFYGRVVDIQPDVKKNWYHLKFKLLIIPPVDITWILRTPQMCGEIFTINNEEHFVVAVDMSMSEDTVSSKKRHRAPSSSRQVKRKFSLVKGGCAE